MRILEGPPNATKNEEATTQVRRVDTQPVWREQQKRRPHPDVVRSYIIQGVRRGCGDQRGCFAGRCVNLAGEVYKAILWGAMKGKIKAIVGNPPCKTLAKDENACEDNLQRYKKERELELLAKQFFLYLASYAAKEDFEPAFVFGAPTAFQGLWNHGMVREFEDVVRSTGVARIQFEQGDLAHPLKAPTTVLQNVNLDYMDGLKDNRSKAGSYMFNEIMYRTERIVSSVSCQWESEGRIGERNNNRRMSSVWMLVDLYERPQEMHMAMATNTFLLPHTRSLSSLDNHHLKNRLPKKSHPWTMTSRTWIWTRLQKKAGHRGMIRNDEEPEGGIGDVVWDEYAPSEPADDEGDPVAMKLDAGKALWDDDELAERQQEEDQEEEAKAEHRPPIPMDHLCYVKPLKSKKSKVVMQAIQEIVLELRNENLPVVRLVRKTPVDDDGEILKMINKTAAEPELVKCLTQLLRMDFPDEVFTSATVIRDSIMPPHKDVFNDRDSFNLVSPLQVPKEAGVWQQMTTGDTYSGKFLAQTINGREVPGQVFPLSQPVRVDPKKWHAPVQGGPGARVVVAGHTIGSWRKLTKPMVEQLEGCGFVVPNGVAEEVAVKAAEVSTEDNDLYDYEIDEEDVIQNFDERDSALEVEQEILKAQKATVENLYTYDIENVLKQLEGELRVVHTVHQTEVEANLKEWVPSMAEEVAALEGMKAIRRRRGQDAKDCLAQPGVMVVPGKGVFTIKPPSKEGTRFRRKSRIVSCGNFQPKSDTESNYSGGAASEAVRFLGMEVKQATDAEGNFDGYTIDQEYEKEQLKEAQSRTGELSWLSQRTRPDICYTVNIMSALATRDPAKANLIGSKCLNYLNATKEWKIHYKPEAGKQLSTYTDSSYAPEGGKSHGGAVTFWSGCPIAWKSSRQALVTTSSAETELVEAHHGSQQMESVDSLLQDIGERAESRALYVDNAAAITLATSEGGSWKTRHLKVRHQALRQKVEDKWLEEGTIIELIYGKFTRKQSLQSETKLTKKEMRQLNGLLQRDPMGLSEEERLELINLAETAGVDLSRVLQGAAKASSSSSARPMPPSPKTTIYEDMVEEDERRRRREWEGDYKPPPPPPPTACAADEEFLRKRRMHEDNERILSDRLDELKGGTGLSPVPRVQMAHMEQELPTTATAEMMDVLGLAKKALAKQDETADRRSREDPWALAEGRQPKWPKPQSKGLSGKGASSWDSWKPHQQEWFNLDAEDKTVDAATQDLLTVLVRMAIRHEEELAKLRIDTTMIFYLDTNSGGILLQVRQVAEHWSNEFEKGRVKSPLKVILLLSIFQEVSSRMTALLQDDAQMAKAKEWQWIQDGATGLDPLWTYFQWNPVEKKQEQSALSPIKNSEVCRHLDFLAQHLAHENVLTKFKATCRMSSTDRYASAVLPFFCSLSLRGDVAARCHQAIRSLVNCSALKTIGMRIKPARAKDSHWLRSWSETSKTSTAAPDNSRENAPERAQEALGWLTQLATPMGACAGRADAALALTRKLKSYRSTLFPQPNVGLFGRRCDRLRSCFPTPGRNTSFSVGAYGHHSHTGLLHQTHGHPSVCKLVNALIVRVHPAQVWTTISFNVDLAAPVHKDVANSSHHSLLIGLSHFDNGQLWAAEVGGSHYREHRGQLISGSSFPVSGAAVMLSARDTEHCVLDWSVAFVLQWLAAASHGCTLCCACSSPDGVSQAAALKVQKRAAQETALQHSVRCQKAQRKWWRDWVITRRGPVDFQMASPDT
ncbi:unnamed protein product, partial [Symbiodinium microadriaticum]